MSLEIHFHRQDEAAVLIESGTPADEEPLGYLALAALYSARTIANLGPGNTSGELLAGLMSALTSQGKLSEIVWHEPDARLVDYQGARGRKGFSARLGIRDDDLKFKLKSWGFGLGARGIGYYAPTSVILLLQALTRPREEDHAFVSALARTCEHIGDLALAGALSVRTQAACAMEALGEGAPLLLLEPDRDDAERRTKLPSTDDGDVYLPRPVSLFTEEYDELLRFYTKARRKQEPQRALMGAVRRAFTGDDLRVVLDFLEGRSDGKYGDGAGANLVAMTIEHFEESVD